MLALKITQLKENLLLVTSNNYNPSYENINYLSYASHLKKTCPIPTFTV